LSPRRKNSALASSLVNRVLSNFPSTLLSFAGCIACACCDVFHALA
jgi:hypothetical protein